jgi:hypothetical protein
MRMLRTLLSAALLGALAMAPGPATAAQGPFSDDDGTPYEQAVEVLAAREIVTGCDDGGSEFCPTTPVRRDQAASLLVRAFPLPATDRDHFDDDDGNVHEDAINRLAAAKISLGCATGGAYCADDDLRRDQMAVLLVRAGSIGRTPRRFFRDTRGTHSGAVNRLAASGITGGCSARPARFCPHQEVLRGEMAVFLARALDLHPRTEITPLPAPKPERATRPKPRPRPAKPTNAVWDRLAECESGGNWSINTGNGYYGGLQFSISSWRAVGGSGYPHTASRAEQIKRGKQLKARQGWGAWPSCTRKLGLR